ncbi:PREDICTED: uncharacterized protein LOC105564648 isoform X2 [Vollenhovia emeryi]|nr:PREDICTED: uncharacterized protein LOC105564648 isoform X2 [Vollenhovia emeryi]
MTKDYEKARDVGNRLLEQNRDDVGVTRALNILKHKIRGGYQGSSLIEFKREGSDATGGDDTDIIDNNADTGRLNNEVKTHHDFKRKMHRVIAIKSNRRVAQIKDLETC